MQASKSNPTGLTRRQALALPSVRLTSRATRRAAHNHKTRSSMGFLELETYDPPAWAKGIDLVPQQRVRLGMLPTPIHRWCVPGLPEGCEMWVKRDDLSGMQMSGNKVRKLEFLMADAKQRGCDCIITIGGIQSNHARATAVAARYLGMECHLILRTSRQAVASDPGLVGNLLVERLVGAQIHVVTKEEYTTKGSMALGQALQQQLEAQGRRPYLIPVGGSNALGTWGYLQAVEEIKQQVAEMGHPGFTDVVMACGSGGTTAGLALGAHLSGLGAAVHAYGVCDDEAYFYKYIDGLLADLGATKDKVGLDSRGLLTAVQARGAGYAISKAEELATVQDVSRASGIVLDPVYSGKALHYLRLDMARQPEAWRGRRVLFVHPGGLLGMYDKADQLQPLVQAAGYVRRLEL